MITIAQLSQWWKQTWFEKTSPSPFCLFRIMFGVIVALTSIASIKTAPVVYSGVGLVTTAAVRAYQGPCLRIGLFYCLPASEANVVAALIVLTISAVTLAIGWQTRLSAAIVWFLLLSFRNQNPFVDNCGDELIQVSSLLVMLGPATRMYSLDAWFSAKRNPLVVPQILCEPWAQRLLQFQMAVVYAASFFYKSSNIWWNGTAVHYVMHVRAYMHFAPPILDQLWISQLGSWGTLAVEFSLFTLIWVKELRYRVLATGLILHSLMLLTMNLPVLELMVMALYVNFVKPVDIERCIDMLMSRFGRRQYPLLTNAESDEIAVPAGAGVVVKTR